MKTPRLPTRRRVADDGPVLVCLQGGRSDDDGMVLSRAEAHALRASASQTHLQLARHLQPVRDAPPPNLT